LQWVDVSLVFAGRFPEISEGARLRLWRVLQQNAYGTKEYVHFRVCHNGDFLGSDK
jgi:hypothetical protein